MRRREFITLLGGAAATPSFLFPLAASAQQAEKARRLGVLMPLAESDQEASTLVATFVKGLQAQGWTIGRDVVIDYRWAAGDAQRIEGYAKDLVEQNSDLILARSSPVVAALMRKTRTTPIVFFQVVDPVGQGFVANLAHPGGNVTGFTLFEPTIGSKWVELLKQMAPGVARVAAVHNPDTAPFADFFLTSIPSAHVSMVKLPIRHASEIEAAITGFAREPNGGLVILPDAFNLTNRETIIAMAARHSLPAIYPFRFFATDGGLMSYGSDPAEAMQQAAVYASRIFKGVKPANLPVQAPTKLTLVINLKTAKALRLAVPDRLLALADEVID
jgi:putative ABC transport system substrate-binding protein